MDQQTEWNSDVPSTYVENYMKARKAAKELRKRLAIEQARRARQREAEAAGETPAAGETTAFPTTTQAPRPPVYVMSTKTIPKHRNVAGVALRKRKGNGRKTRRRKTRYRK